MAEKPKPKIPLLCPQGKTFQRVIIGQSSDGEIWDLTNWKARIEIRSSLPQDPNSEVLILLTTENGGIMIETINNESRVIIRMDARTTASFPVGSYIWELELEDASGFVPYLMAPSKFKVVAENTVYDG